MSNFNSLRRDFLRMTGPGLAAAAIPAFSLATASAQDASTSSTGYFDVRKYGATGDGKTLDTEAVNRAIEAAAAAGGGVVVFPAGNYLCFSIHLKSFVHLRLLQGSTIVAADSPLPGEQTGYHGGTYDAAEPKTAWDAYQDYGHNHWHNSLLWGEDIHDFSITGPGLICGKGLFGQWPRSQRRWRALRRRAGGRRQQGNRTQELPQRALARLFDSERRALRPAADRR